MTVYKVSYTDRNIKWFDKRYAQHGLSIPPSGRHTIYYDIVDKGRHLALVPTNRKMVSNLTAIIQPYEQTKAKHSDICFIGKASGHALHFVQVYNPDRLAFSVYDCLMLCITHGQVINWAINKEASNV